MSMASTASVGFPVVGVTKDINSVSVHSYPQRHNGTKSCAYVDKSKAVKTILGHSRSDEEIDTVDIDVVVKFANPDFSGNSFGLALALADKLARFGSQHTYPAIVATGTLETQGIISAVDGFAEKLDIVAKEATRDSLFIYSQGNTSLDASIAKQLEANGVTLRSASCLAELQDLWQSRATMQEPTDDARHSNWLALLRGVTLGIVLVAVVTGVLMVYRLAY